MIEETVDVQHMVEELKRERDAVAQLIHSNSADFSAEWDALESKWDDMRRKGFEVLQLRGESSDEVWDAVLLLRDELKVGYERIKREL